VNVGFFLTTQFPLDRSMETIATDLRAQVSMLESGGFDGVYVGEHHATRSIDCPLFWPESIFEGISPDHARQNIVVGNPSDRQPDIIEDYLIGGLCLELHA